MLFTATPNNTFEPTGCENETFEYTPMSKVDVHWTYKKGDKVIDMGYLNVETLRKLLLNEFKEQNLEELTREDFVEFSDATFYREEDDNLPSSEELFDTIIDTENKGFITQEDVRNFSREKLKTIARAVDAPHGPVAGSDEDEGLAAQRKANKHGPKQEGFPENGEESIERDEL